MLVKLAWEVVLAPGGLLNLDKQAVYLACAGALDLLLMFVCASRTQLRHVSRPSEPPPLLSLEKNKQRKSTASGLILFT